MRQTCSECPLYDKIFLKKKIIIVFEGLSSPVRLLAIANTRSGKGHGLLVNWLNNSNDLNCPNSSEIYHSWPHSLSIVSAIRIACE